ncbi:head-tail adaptor protein [Acetobacter oeni]|uniref:Head-tail adaptor protein n=1 Tax=Acetobacter oeni TaxID=304077 RepID=A0A511XP17_9PROT|nr:hypothetical protein [Acetobacter oeni]MBB3884486.1 hypothetical protein [Acetobacter oeni]NHO20418.1 hypothetical protein [Acetobacter oeni]GBR00528.1 bacteriophage protein [Acetobacter oeni LMG 21952]GEN64703.1 hypothetical protein AOE01nite_29270 [Acetobacter oeni]
MAEDEAVRIGRLRWPLILATRQQAAQIGATGIDESLTNLQRIYGDVQPVGALTFWGTNGTVQQIDEAQVTHRIFVRWTDALLNSEVFVRISKRVNQTDRMEIFRVRRLKELGGRKRFVCAECQMERIGDPWPIQ